MRSVFNGRYTGYSTFYQWDQYGTLSISNFSDFTVANTCDREYTLSIYSTSAETSCSLAGMEIEYKTTSALKYSPSTYTHSSIGGTEYAEYAYADSFDYASSYVYVDSNSDGSRTIRYNSYTYVWE